MSAVTNARFVDATKLDDGRGRDGPAEVLLSIDATRLGADHVSNLHPSVSTATSWIQWLPGLTLLPSYKLSWLPRDIIAGLVLTTMLAPVGVAYAIASGVGAINGLYATVACLLAYAAFGPSRILVLGPDSSLATIIFGVVAPLSGGDPGRAVALAGVMALVSGTVLVLAGIAWLGFVTDLLSKPIRYGYMNGIALTVLISQLPKLFGFKIESAGPLRDIWTIARAISAGKTNWSEFALGGATLLGILLVKRSRPFPGVLTAMLGATAIVYFFTWPSARTFLCLVHFRAAYPRWPFPGFHSRTSSRSPSAVAQLL